MECILHYPGGEPTLLKERLWFYEDFVLSCYYKPDFRLHGYRSSGQLHHRSKKQKLQKIKLFKHSQEYQSEPKT